MRVTIIDKRSGQAKTMEARFAKILVAMGKAYYAGGEVAPGNNALGERGGESFIPSTQVYETRHMEAAPTKRRGRPPGSKNSQLTSDKP